MAVSIVLLLFFCYALQTESQTEIPSPPSPPAPEYCPRTDSQESFQQPNPPRVFPFCVGKNLALNRWDGVLKDSGFYYIFDRIDKKLNEPNTDRFEPFRYISTRHHFLHQDTKMKIFNLETRLTSMNTWTSMDNWAVVEFELVNTPLQLPIEGVYIQAIHGPLGIPFGEFVKFRHSVRVDGNNPHNPTPSAPNSFIESSVIMPCTFYSLAGPTIPSVFIWSTILPNSKPFKGRFNVTFRWHDHACAEVAFFQFVMLIVFDWRFTTTTFRTWLSPIIFSTRLGHSTDGPPFPFYPDWGPDEVRAYLNPRGEQAVFKHIPSFRDYRIISNKDYENCVQHGTGLVRGGPSRGACPPGPFVCRKEYIRTRSITPAHLSNRYENYWIVWSSIYSTYNPAKEACGSGPHGPELNTTEPESTTNNGSAFPTTTPLTTTTTPRPLTEVDNQTKVVAVIAKKVEKQKVISHGDLCVLVWFILVPSSNFFARFFKDFPNWKALGVGFWIVSHIVLHHVAVLVMWISFGLVVSNGKDFFGGASGSHYIFGFPCILIQHYELFSGFVRDQKIQSAQRQSILHSVAGYSSVVLSLCCAINSNIEPVKAYLIIALFCLNLIAVIVGTVVEHRISKRLGMYPSRKLFPVMERIVMVDAKPRNFKLRIFFAVIYLVIKCLVFIPYVIYDEVRKRK